MTLEELSELFKQKGLTLGSVESFTGGSFASKITSIPGASKFFKGALVTYWTEVKNNVLGISKEITDKYGVVSKEVAYLMAESGKRLLNVDYCVSFTGNAGPEAMENKPVGEVFLAIASKDIEVYEYHLKGTRKDIQEAAISLIIEEISKKIKKM